MPPRKPHVDVVALVKQARPEVILQAASLCNGHSIFKPKALLETGLPAEVVAHMTRTYKSDLSDPKSTVFVHDRPVKELRGVYGLELLEFLARALGVEYPGKLGRSSQAQAIQEALHAHCTRKGAAGRIETPESQDDPKGGPPASARANRR